MRVTDTPSGDGRLAPHDRKSKTRWHEPMVTEVKPAVVAGGRRGNWKEKSPRVGAKGHRHGNSGEPDKEGKCPEIRFISVTGRRAAGQTAQTLRGRRGGRQRVPGVWDQPARLLPVALWWAGGTSKYGQLQRQLMQTPRPVGTMAGPPRPSHRTAANPGPRQESHMGP